MSSPPPNYTTISDDNASSTHKNEPIFIASIIAPYALLSLLIPTTVSLPELLPFLLLSSVVHFYTHPHTISRLFLSFSPDSLEGQKKLWTAGDWQIKSLSVLVVGLVGARMEMISALGVAIFIMFPCGGVAWAICHDSKQPYLSLSLSRPAGPPGGPIAK
jgi:hypothetical protein